MALLNRCSNCLRRLDWQVICNLIVSGLEVLFAGNQAIQPEIRSTFENTMNLHFAPNIRPSLDHEQLGRCAS